MVNPATTEVAVENFDLIPVGFDGGESTAAASEGDQTASGEAATGASGDGGSGTETGADAFAAERERLEAARRDLQSERDRLRSELDSLKSQGSGEGESTQPSSTDPRALAREVAAEVRREMAVESEKARLQADSAFADADSAIYERNFSSPEELRAAVEASAQANKAKIDARVEAELKTKLEKAAKQYGFQLQTPPDSGQAPTGDPTLAQLKAMSMDEFDKVPSEVVDRVLRTANQ